MGFFISQKQPNDIEYKRNINKYVFTYKNVFNEKEHKTRDTLNAR